MKKILVPTDFSSYAMKAVLYAAELAKKANATLYLLHVEKFNTASNRTSLPLESELAGNTLNELNAVQHALTSMYPSVTTQVQLVSGAVIPAILDAITINNVDLVIMGTKGATGFKEIFLGSIAAGIIGTARVPVLAIPYEYELEEPGHILFATSHFEENKHVLDNMVALAKLFDATIHVAVFIDTDKAEATDYLYNTRRLANYIEFLNKAYPGVNFKADLLEGEEFEQTIELYEGKNEVHIIAMITYHKNLWQKMLQKSKTKQMAFHSKIPIMAIPGNELDDVG